MLQPLYAKIKEIAWPKSASRRNCELLQDGSIRITSQDEFGSLILSSHSRDFTVCYLSLLSQEKVKERHREKKRAPIQADSKQAGNHSDIKNNSNQSAHSDQSHDFPRANENKDDLNISPITQASCADSPQALSNASGSPVTPLDTVKDCQAKFRPFSTPTQELDQSDPVCTPYGKTAVFRNYNLKNEGEKVRFENDSLEHLKENKSGKDDKTQMKSDNIVTEQRARRKEKKKKDRIVTSHYTPLYNDTITNSVNLESRHQSAVSKLGPSEKRCINISTESRNSEQGVIDSSTESFVSGDGKSSPRCNYCWVTQHISCDECPVTWSHVVKIAKSVAENGIPTDKTGEYDSVIFP